LGTVEAAFQLAAGDADTAGTTPVIN